MGKKAQSLSLSMLHSKVVLEIANGNRERSPEQDRLGSKAETNRKLLTPGSLRVILGLFSECKAHTSGK